MVKLQTFLFIDLSAECLGEEDAEGSNAPLQQGSCISPIPIFEGGCEEGVEVGQGLHPLAPGLNLRLQRLLHGNQQRKKVLFQRSGVSLSKRPKP